MATITDFLPGGYVPTEAALLDGSLATMNGTPLLLIAKKLGHANTSIVEKHYGHLAPVNAIRAGCPKLGFTPDASATQLLPGGGRRAAVHEVLVGQLIGRGIRRMSRRITPHS